MEAWFSWLIAWQSSPGHFISADLVILVVLLVAARRVISRVDCSSSLPAPPLPPIPDPFAIAYLRGGVHEVARLALFGLVEQGFLKVFDWRNGKIGRSSAPGVGKLSALEHAALARAPAREGKVEEMMRNSALTAELTALCTPLAERLQADCLLAPPTAHRVARTFRLGGSIVLVLLVVTAFTLYGWSGLTLASIPIPWFFAYCRSPQPSRRGRTYLRTLRTAFSQLRTKLDEAEPHQIEALRLCVALFGFRSLQGTAWQEFSQLFPKSAGRSWRSRPLLGSDADGCGCGAGSCGSSDDGCGCGCG